MHGRTGTWLAVLLSLLATCAGPALAQDPEDATRLPPDDRSCVLASESVYAAPDPAAPARLASDGMAAPAGDLQARVAALEARLDAIAKREAAEKEKAARHPSVTAGGRIQVDWALFGQGPASRAVYGDVQDGVALRRARIFVQGEAFHVVDYKVAMDFADTDIGSGPTQPVYDGAGNQLVDAGGNPVRVVTSTKAIQSTAFKDVYITLNELPWLGHVRVGHIKEPFGLEELTSTRFTTFMERSVADEGAFCPGRRIGVMAFDTYAGQRGTWAIGAFRSELTNGAKPPFRMNDDGGTAVTMRLTFLPWYDEASGGRGLLHAGIAYSYRAIDDGTVRVQVRPQAHLAPFVADTGNLGAPVGTLGYVPDEQLLGAEAALVYGPFSVQAEYFAHWVPRHGIGVANLNGCYVHASCFLTGENRRYDRRYGIFDRVEPFEPFFRVRTDRGVRTGWGAWEVAYRYSQADLVDTPADVNGGLAHQHTFGLNWYLNAYTRMMWNYVLSTSTNDYGVNPLTDMSIFEMRCMIDF